MNVAYNLYLNMATIALLIIYQNIVLQQVSVLCEICHFKAKNRANREIIKRNVLAFWKME